MKIDKKGCIMAKGHDDNGDFTFKGQVKKGEFSAKKIYEKVKIHFAG